MPKTVLLVYIVTTILLIAYISFCVARLRKKGNENIVEISKYTVRLYQRGYNDTSHEYILHNVEGTDVLDAAENAKVFVTKNGYFGILSAQKNYDEIMKLLIVDSVEKE